MKTSIRPPAVAGRFYAATAGRLEKELEELFRQSEPRRCDNVRAVISPHAGYIFSGSVAASAFNQVDSEEKYERIFVIGSSHHVHFEGAAVYTEGDFRTPLGHVTVDVDCCRQLVSDYPDLFISDSLAHRDEHSIEVQLPFLQYVLKDNFTIVPIVIGTARADVCKRIAEVLAPFMRKENLFVISTDFSHYPQYKDAIKVDTATKDAILSNDPDVLLKTLESHDSRKIPGLATGLCGWTSVLTLLYMTTGNHSIQYTAIDYKNSGDTREYGEKDQVVGYWAIAVSEQEFSFTSEEQAMLLDMARKGVEAAVLGSKDSAFRDRQEYPKSLHRRCGAFVTLYQNKKLRGCIGRMTSDIPLYKLVREMAVAAALYDDRFYPVGKNDLKDLDIEITLLSPLVPVTDVKQIELGKHGILIEGRGRSGVFLPQVATETGWTLEEFLGHCSRDKAGLGWEGWKTARLYVFTGKILHGDAS